jgi:murein L,D-transpeptidase YafK
LPVVKELFEKAGVAFPPAQIAFVAYKQEKELEVWASSEDGGKAERIATYGICAASGVPGPKRFEGDHQVPEGYYVLQYGWAESNYHLEMKVSYPNMVDKVLGPKDRPLGGEIMIHGDCASIGCLAMGDERVEELWVMMKAKGDAQVKVHIYPSRDMDALLEDPNYASHHAFWQNLKEGRDRFERERRIFGVKADWHGVYMYE